MVKPTVMFLSGATAAILVIAEVAALLKTVDTPDATPALPVLQKYNVVYSYPGTRDVKRPSGKRLVPRAGGIYETLPYAILLKVPGDAGDHCVLKNQEAAPSMPTLHPKLRLVPPPRAPNN